MFGTGNPAADILIVKDAPSNAEDRRGTHLTTDLQWLCKVYKAAFNSRTSLETVAEKLLERVFIVSATMCAGIHDAGEVAGTHRKVSDAEVKACRPRLIDTLYAVDPLVVIAYGNRASRALFGARTGIDRTGTALTTLEVPGVLGGVIAYSVIVAPDLADAERAGDYTYKEGKVASITNSLKRAFELADAINHEDSPR
ncbi:MAG: uracil-DNA glycosylase family protein [Candidatus Limnocylindrus sp.]